MIESSKAGSPANHPQPAPAPAHSSHAGLIITLVLCLLAAGAVVWVIQRHKAAAAGKTTAARNAQPSVPVIVGKAISSNVPIYLDGLGTVQAFNTVTVQSRVDGQLMKVLFVEGQEVHAGDVLDQIDPAPYKAALGQAVGKRAQDDAQLANARIDLDRETQLLAAKIDTQQAYDTQAALVRQDEAAVKADDAAIDSAQVELDYTTILAPFDGRTGIRLVDVGNIVHATDTNGLVVITQVQPISVIFTLPEQTLGQIRDQTGTNRSPDSFAVLAVDRDNSTRLGDGTLTVIDNQIDATTGTIKLKATFPNTDLRLWPGQFVNTRLLLTTRMNGTVVPASVVQRGPDGDYAFLVEGTGTNLTVRQQNITVVQSEAGSALIDSGLTPGQTVVVDGQYKLQNGSKVTVTRSGGGGRGTNSTNNAALQATNP